MMETRPGSGANAAETSRRPVLLFGAGGNLGSAIRSRLLADGHHLYTIAWTQAAEWLGASGTSSALNAIRGEILRITGSETDILFAGGDTNPNHSAGALHRSNTQFPQAVISATATLGGFRYVTFGTIMETFAGMAQANPYIASKVALGQWIANQTQGAHAPHEGAAPDPRGCFAHLQIHTLYGGGAPTPHMFLGQLVAALRKRQPFSMSAGRQLREYHHIDDIAGAVARLLSRPAWDTQPIMPLSSGQPVPLASLAQSIFQSAGRSSDLRIGELPTHDAENLAKIFAPAPEWLMQPSREPIAGVCDWIDGLLRDQGGISGKPD